MGSANWIDGPGLGAQQFELALAQGRLGLSGGNLLEWFINLAAEGPLPWNGVGGTGAIPWASGALSFQTGATAGGFGRLLLYSDGGGNFGRFIRSGQNWAISARFAVTTAITAQSQAWCGAENNAGTAALAMGVHGPTSTANFVLKGLTGTPINSGVAIDTNFHTHRAWKFGGVTTYMVDNTAVTGNVDVNTDVMPYLIVQNGTDNVNRAMSAIWLAAYSPSL